MPVFRGDDAAPNGVNAPNELVNAHELDDGSQSSASIDLENNNEECIIVFEAIAAWRANVCESHEERGLSKWGK